MLILTSGELFVADYEFQLHSCALSQKEKGEMFTAENKKPLTQTCKGLFLFEIIGGQYKIRTCDIQLRRLRNRIRYMLFQVVNSHSFLLYYVLTC